MVYRPCSFTIRRIMNKTWILVLVMIGVLCLSCNKMDTKGLVLKPSRPKAGEKLKVTYRPGLELKSPVLALQKAFEDSFAINVIPMTKEKGNWVCEILLDTNIQFLWLMIEDESGQRIAYKEKERMFPFAVLSKDGKYPENTYLNFAWFWVAFEDTKKVEQYLKKEMKAYPFNPSTYDLLWYVTLKEKGEEGGKAFIKKKVEELERQEPNSENPGALKAIISQAYFYPLDDPQKGLSLLEEGLEKHPDSDFSGALWSVPDSSFTEKANKWLKTAKGKNREIILLLRTYEVNSDSLVPYTEEFVKEFPDNREVPELTIDAIRRKYNYPQGTGKISDEMAAAVEQWLIKYPAYEAAVNFKVILAEKYYTQKDPARALILFEECLKDSTLSAAEALNDLAQDRAEKVKNLDGAERAIKRAIEIVTIGNLRKGHKWWAQSYERGGEHYNYLLGIYYNTYGWVKYKQGEADTATKLMEKAVGYYKDAKRTDKEVWERLAMLYEKQGQQQEKIKELYLDILVEQEDTLIENKLLALYIKEGNKEEDFNNYLKTQIIKKISLIKLNEPAPDFTINDIAGQRIRLSDLRGKVVVLKFWATWCGPCKREIPELNNMVDEFKDNDKVVFIGISNEKKETLEKFLKEIEFKYRICYDGEEASRSYKVNAIPVHIIIDSGGNIQYKHIGMTDAILLKNEIEALL